MAHTKSPWKLASYTILDHSFHDWHIVCAAKRGQIIRCKRLEDAKLVSAAPDLLEALQAVINSVPFHSGHQGTLERAQTAIKKATT